ncbi:hypothetical protein [Cupriavidus pauculus]|uniref:hypothetical protein n=1 Tax=Cupriavidus pauculus TaxID=82633 RepID=UPI001FCFD6B6|nr:hypothetical protein [Cupriavidus pauculus]
MKGPFLGAHLVAAIIFQTLALAHSAETMAAEVSATRSDDCGIKAKLPTELSDDDRTKFQPCIGSYKSDQGAVFSFAPVSNGAHDANWIDRIPALHIRSVPILVERESNFGRNFSATPKAPRECNLVAISKIKDLSGRNWHGWLAEDNYRPKNKRKIGEDYCRTNFADRICLRMLIGNSKESAVMSQYCLPKENGFFDLDEGINYKMFLEIINSLEFIEN